MGIRARLKPLGLRRASAHGIMPTASPGAIDSDGRRLVQYNRDGPYGPRFQA